LRKAEPLARGRWPLCATELRSLSSGWEETEVRATGLLTSASECRAVMELPRNGVRRLVAVVSLSR